jgi:hypothetical protein
MPVKIYQPQMYFCGDLTIPSPSCESPRLGTVDKRCQLKNICDARELYLS